VEEGVVEIEDQGEALLGLKPQRRLLLLPDTRL
jgi:hypothetical protein